MPEEQTAKPDPAPNTGAPATGATGTANPPANPPPTTITLTPEELRKQIQTAIEEAATAEKNKLNNTLTKLKDDNKTITDELEKFRAKEKLAADKAEEERKAKLSAEEKLAEEQKKLSTTVDQVKTAMDLLVKETDEKLRKKDLEVLKERLILGANGKIIPELVFGNTPEEIQANFVASQKRYDEILKQAAIQTSTNSTTTPPISTETKPTGSTTPPAETQKSSSDVMSMTPEEFSSYKNATLSKYGV